MRVVVGLGNPGARYARTRHNIGFLVAADLAAGSGWVDRWSAQTATLRIAGETVLIVRPQTYMNRSGDAVLALSELEGFSIEETLVVFDDFLLDFGRIRLRRSGSDGGHNGLSSIIEGLRTDAVPRLRLGVGREAGEDMAGREPPAQGRESVRDRLGAILDRSKPVEVERDSELERDPENEREEHERDQHRERDRGEGWSL